MGMHAYSHKHIIHNRVLRSVILLLPLIFLLHRRETTGFVVHRYPTRSNLKKLMEKMEADMATLGTRMDARVGQLMEIIQNMALQQEELRDLVVRPVTPQNNAIIKYL